MTTAKKKTQATSKAKSTPEELRAVAGVVLSSVPGAAVSWKFHNASFDVNGKVFAFTRPGGMAMKLPGATLDRLVENGDAAHLVMGKRTMREWVVVQADDVAELLPLLKDAALYVGSLRKGKP